MHLTWLEKIIRSVFFAIDNVIYSFISFLYELLMYLANVDLFSSANTTGSGMLAELTSRLYILLGIFMLFKVSFSILQYIVDPNSFSDKSQGMGKLVTNALVVLVLLVLTPTIFDFAYKIQSTILTSNAIPKLILGDSVGDKIDTATTKDRNEEPMTINAVLANDMKFLVFGSFATINTDLVASCQNSPVLGTKDMAKNTGCIDEVNTIIDENTSRKIGDFFRTSNELDARDFRAYGDFIAIDKKEEFYIDYQFGFSTLAGIFIIVMLISYCIAVAVRIIKLFFLQLIAPIPIVSYIDPKQSKDGTMMKWARECGKTYISLFIHLAIIFLAFYLIDLVASTIMSTEIYYETGNKPEGLMSVFVNVFIILGILIFANQAPKLIEELFGFKSSGDFSVNPLKRIKDSSLATGAIAGGIGAVTGATLGAATAFNTSRGMQRGVGRSIVSGMGGIFSGATRGVKSGVKNRNSAFGFKAAAGSVGQIADSMKMRKETGSFGQAAATVSELTNAPYKVDAYDETMEKRSTYNSHLEEAMKIAKNKAENDPTVKVYNRMLRKAKQEGNKKEQARLEQQIENTKTHLTKKYFSNNSDEEIVSHLKAAQRIKDENKNIAGLSDVITSQGPISLGEAQTAIDEARTANTVLKNSNEYEDAKAEKDRRQSAAKRSWTNTQNK